MTQGASPRMECKGRARNGSLHAGSCIGRCSGFSRATRGSPRDERRGAGAQSLAARGFTRQMVLGVQLSHHRLICRCHHRPRATFELINQTKDMLSLQRQRQSKASLSKTQRSTFPPFVYAMQPGFRSPYLELRQWVRPLHLLNGGVSLLRSLLHHAGAVVIMSIMMIVMMVVTSCLSPSVLTPDCWMYLRFRHLAASFAPAP